MSKRGSSEIKGAAHNPGCQPGLLFVEALDGRGLDGLATVAGNSGGGLPCLFATLCQIMEALARRLMRGGRDVHSAPLRHPRGHHRAPR